MKQKPILLKGYFQENLGDDLFFKIITERFPDIPFYTYSCIGFHSKTLQHSNLSVPCYIKLLSPFFSTLLHLVQHRKLYGLVYRIICLLERKLKRIDPGSFSAEVSLIGSCFMEKRDNGIPLKLEEQQFSRDYVLKNPATPKFLCGANIGPVYSYDYLSEIMYSLEEYTDVCFRDKVSYNLYSFMKNVRYAPDIVFNLDVSNYKGVLTKKQILVNLIDLENKLGYRNSLEAYRSLIGVLEKYLQAGYFIKLVSFCKAEKDEQVLKKIKKTLKTDKCSLLFYNGRNVDKILREFAQSEYIICGRFHSMIIAMLFQKPFFAICYDDKMLNYLNDLAYEGTFFDINALEHLSFSLVEENHRKNIVLDINGEIKNAHRQFLILDEFIHQFRNDDATD